MKNISDHFESFKHQNKSHLIGFVLVHIECTLQIYTAGIGTHVKNVKVTSTAGPWHMRFFRLGKIRIFQIRMTEIQVSRYVICLKI